MLQSHIGSHSVCAVKILLGVDWKILSVRKVPILSGFLTLNAKIILPLEINEFGCYNLVWTDFCEYAQSTPP